MSITDIAIILAQPFGLSLLLLLAIWRPWRAGDTSPTAGALPLSIAMAYPLGRWAISGLPSFPPPTADEWLVFAAFVAGMWAIAEVPLSSEKMGRLRPLILISLRLGIIAGLFWLMASSHITLLTYLALVLGVFSLIILVDRSTRQIPAPITLWTLTIIALASAPILLMGASFRLALLAAALGTIAAAGALVTTLFPAARRVSLSPLLFPFCLLLSGLYLSGVRFAQTPLLSALLIAIALLVPLLIPARSRFIVVRLLAVLLISAGAISYTYYETQVAEKVIPESVSDEHKTWEHSDPYSW